jgi:hypothetical protein
MDMLNLREAFEKKEWNLYQWMSTSTGSVWTYYVRDSSGNIVSEAKSPDEALKLAYDEWMRRLKDKAIEELNKKHTRQLLNLLAGLRIGRPYWWWSENLIETLPEEYEVTSDDVRKILRTRPHIPCKREAKVIRKAKAAKQRSYEKNRVRNKHHKKAVENVQHSTNRPK